MIGGFVFEYGKGQMERAAGFVKGNERHTLDLEDGEKPCSVELKTRYATREFSGGSCLDEQAIMVSSSSLTLLLAQPT